MKLLVLAIIVLIILTAQAYAANVNVRGPVIYCPACPACPYLGYACPVPYYYSNPNAAFSYDQYYRYGSYSTPNSYVYEPGSQFPPYLGIDASRQWFAQPSR